MRIYVSVYKIYEYTKLRTLHTYIYTFIYIYIYTFIHIHIYINLVNGNFLGNINVRWIC